MAVILTAISGNARYKCFQNQPYQSKMQNLEGQHTIFYAWQSDSPEQTNRSAIRVALQAAIANNEAERNNLRLQVDEATRGMAGSQNVPDSIRLKIEASAIFVADVTTINPTSSDTERRCPNPNVAFEIGYAAAHLGWPRMILLTNTAIGAFKDLPFDFDRHRISQYNLDSSASAKQKKKLVDLLTVAIREIIDQDPKRPSELRALSPTEVKRKRDVANAVWALSHIHTQTLNEHIHELPRIINEKILFFYEGFHGVITNGSFHIYDTELDKALRKLDRAWTTTLAFDHRYRSNDHGLHIFDNPMDGPLDRKQQRDWDKIQKARSKMAKQLAILLGIIRGRYLEIDADETDKTALNRYRELQREIRRLTDGDEIGDEPTDQSA